MLVDEFQDTNIIQYEWLKLLTERKQNLFVVGDDDQSIHKSQGFITAITTVILLVPFTNPDAEWFAADAYPCDKNGKISQGFEYPVPFLAKDFGNVV